jgi:hypothetical protein
MSDDVVEVVPVVEPEPVDEAPLIPIEDPATPLAADIQAES